MCLTRLLPIGLTLALTTLAVEAAADLPPRRGLVLT